MEIATTRIIEVFLYPPSGPLLLLFAGILLLRRYRRWGYGVLIGASVMLYLSAIPAVSTLLFPLLETASALTPAQIAESEAEAIVVLGGGRYHNAPEYGGDTVNGFALERLRYAAYLYRTHPLPVAVIGGDPLKTGISEASLMRQVLEEEFTVPVRYSDGRSTNTFDNARYAAEQLLPEGIDHILLVSHAWHLPRAGRAFARAGFTVTPAPTLFYRPSPSQSGLAALIPDARAMAANRWVLHELIGMVWYRLFIESSDSGETVPTGR